MVKVEKMKYLGMMLNASGSCDDKIEQRIAAVSNVIGAMRKQVLDWRELNKSIMKVYNVMVLPTSCMDVRHGQCKDDMKAGCKLWK